MAASACKLPEPKYVSPTQPVSKERLKKVFEALNESAEEEAKELGELQKITDPEQAAE